VRPYFLLEPGDGLLLCGPDGVISHVDRTAILRLGRHTETWLSQPLKQCWPALSELIIQERDRLHLGPRDHVLALAQPTPVELGTRVRLFRTDDGFGIGILRRRAQRFDDLDSGSPEDTYRRLLEAVLDTVQDAVLVTLAEPLDAPGPLILFANQSLLDQTGYHLHELLGRSPRLFQGPKTCRETTARLRRAMDQWQPSRMQVLNYRRDGQTCWIDLKVAPMADPNGWYTHWVSVQRDVSDRVAHEQRLASEALSLAERLNAGVPIG
jgi:PAS domain S-box-containing protein